MKELAKKATSAAGKAVMVLLVVSMEIGVIVYIIALVVRFVRWFLSLA